MEQSDRVERFATAFAKRTSRRGVISHASRVVVAIAGGSALVAADSAYAGEDYTAGDENAEEIDPATIVDLVTGSCCYCWTSCTCPGPLGANKRLRIVYCCPCCQCTKCPREHTIKTTCSNYAC